MTPTPSSFLVHVDSSLNPSACVASFATLCSSSIAGNHACVDPHGIRSFSQKHGLSFIPPIPVLSSSDLYVPWRYRLDHAKLCEYHCISVNLRPQPPRIVIQRGQAYCGLSLWGTQNEWLTKQVLSSPLGMVFLPSGHSFPFCLLLVLQKAVFPITTG